MPKSRRSTVFTSKVRCRKLNKIIYYCHSNWNWIFLWPSRIQEKAGGRHQRWHLRPFQKASDLAGSGTESTLVTCMLRVLVYTDTDALLRGAFRVTAMKEKTWTLLWLNRTLRWGLLWPNCCWRASDLALTHWCSLALFRHCMLLEKTSWGQTSPNSMPFCVPGASLI